MECNLGLIFNYYINKIPITILTIIIEKIYKPVHDTQSLFSKNLSILSYLNFNPLIILTYFQRAVVSTSRFELSNNIIVRIYYEVKDDIRATVK